MLELNNEGIKSREEWEKRGFKIPKFNREKVIKETKENPTWIHFGAGNIFRSFPAALQQTLLDEGKTNKGIIVAEGYDYEIIEKVNKKHDDLSVMVILKANGTVEKTVIGSITESLALDSDNEKDFERLKEIFRKTSLQMASFTITEKGYSLIGKNENFIPEVEEDFKNGPKKPKSYIGKISALCYERYLNNRMPIALVSMDNCSHNGSKLYNAINTFAMKWVDNGKAEEGFLKYINNGCSVTFPWTMIDKITPRPDDSVKNMLIESGFSDVEPIITSKNTYVASFTNAEEAEYLVIEDSFPNGRPKLEEVGVKFTDGSTVDRVEKMKVCTCLNPLHTALAVFGCLLSYTRICEEMKDPQLRSLVENIGYLEGLPVVVDPKIISPKDFIDEVLTIRIPNPFMPDTPQRIATDTSQKLPIRFGETIKAYLKDPKLEVSQLKFIPIVIAGWCRYLLGVDDNGNKFEISDDPMLSILREHLKGIKLGQKGPFHEELKPILSNEKIFGLDLYKADLGSLIELCFEEMIDGKGAVRRTLKNYL
ncbi:mannitol dehydrogenase family protein [Clostridium sp. HBUAS56017]|uniref:mannitol dehydrogenase family protein n=1 Tax=Clostridium sp. HBUAS56017 TaxID=2571128 RepID=UPI00242B2E74|nr:mannitol dehydrogenase family protein [Clostridium sp. HBUAS56017]